MFKKAIIISILVAILFSAACKKVEPKLTTENRPDDISIFIWAGMYENYLWYNEVSNLSISMLQDLDKLYAFLNSYNSDYEELFSDLLFPLDISKRWSWIIEDWEEQERSFSGISTSMGYDFRLVQFYGSDDIFGYVRYVLPGSPAELAGVERGDLFMKVDDQQLTINNYYSLLFEQVSYDLALAYFSDPSTVSLTGETVSMTSVEIQENPVFISKVMDIGDGLKTGYMVYNAFTSDFDENLNDAFGNFKAEGINRLILDLRYNGGGSIRTAQHLASMIYSTDENKVFALTEFNDKLQEAYIDYYGEDVLKEYFTGLLDTTTYSHQVSLPPINSLGLSEVFIIGTSSTASASEMIINGLNPYMNVVQIGDTTRGKYVGSYTVKDTYTTGSVNTEHKWAIQPIVLKISNSVGVTDYPEGLYPDVPIEEDMRNLLPLGDPQEALLAATINHILGNRKVSMRPDYELLRFRVVADSKDKNRFSDEMYIRYPKHKMNKEFLFFQEK